jgi:predicted nucleic acid-binding protein
MSAFADSSALVKLYAEESGFEAVRDLRPIVIAQLSRVEVPSAIWKKYRRGEITQGEATILVGWFEADFHGTAEEGPRFLIMPTSPVVLEAAARIVRKHGLRAYDAVQLASAVLAAEANPELRSFAVFDKQLRSAAFAEGFTLIPD